MYNVYSIAVPSPIVSVTNGSTLYTGSISLFNCTATINNSNIDVDIDPVFTWSMNGVPIDYKTTRFSKSDTMNDNTGVYHSQLQIAPLLKQDESVLECTVHIYPKPINGFIQPSDNVMGSTMIRVKGISIIAVLNCMITLFYHSRF